jgi:hypothetical protein
VIVAQAELDAILDRKVRKRLLELPVRYAPKLGDGDKGALRRCPMRVGGVYHLSAPVPYERYAARAGAQPNRARAVLWLIGICERHRSKPVTITVRSVERQGETWLVSFLRGDEAEAFNDSPLYLAGDGGFTMVASRQAVRGDPEYLAPFAEDLERARESAREKRIAPHREGLAAVHAAHKRLAERKHTMQVRARRRLALIERETEKLVGELALDSGAILGESDRAESQSPADVEGERPPNGTRSDVRSAPAQLSEEPVDLAPPPR